MSTPASSWFSFMGCPLRHPHWRDGGWMLLTLLLLGTSTWIWAHHTHQAWAPGLMWSGVGAWAVGQHRLGLPFQGECTFRAMALTILGGGAWVGGVWMGQWMGWL